MNTYVKWQGTTKFHSISLTTSGGTSFDVSASRITTMDANRTLTTHCGREVPAAHVAYNGITTEQFNNEYCHVCRGHLRF